MDAASVKNLIEQLIPFVKKTGVVAEELTATKVKLRLPHDRDQLESDGHPARGRQLHAGGDGGGGDVRDGLRSARDVHRQARRHRLQAAGQGRRDRTSQLTPIDAQRILDEVARTGKTDAPIVVDVVDAAGEPVATATVTMSVRKI